MEPARRADEYPMGRFAAALSVGMGAVGVVTVGTAWVEFDHPEEVGKPLEMLAGAEVVVTWSEETEWMTVMVMVEVVVWVEVRGSSAATSWGAMRKRKAEMRAARKRILTACGFVCLFGCLCTVVVI